MYRIPFSPPSCRLAAIMGEEPDLLSMASTSDPQLTDTTVPIPEEDSIMSEGFQGDRIQGMSFRLGLYDHVILVLVTFGIVRVVVLLNFVRVVICHSWIFPSFSF